MMNKILCFWGFHDWGYRSKDTGIYLHSFYDGTLPMPLDYYDKKKCWSCEKEIDL